MVCVYCGSETKVTNSRLQKRNNQVWRRRQCVVCQAVFTTHESIELESALSVDKKGRSEPFLPDLLLKELMMSLNHRKDVYKPADISKTTAEVLKRFDKRAYLRYVSDHPSLQ